MHRCLGYDEPFLFANQALPGPQELRSKKSARQHKDYWNQKLSSFVSVDQDTGTQIAPMVPLVGFKDNIVISHFISNLRIGFEQNPVSTSDAPTMRAVMKSFGKRTSAYVSGLSVAETYFSQIHKVAHMQSHAAALYSHALGRLRLDLQYINNDFDRARAFFGLWTAYFLSLYELISSSTSGM
ncbi:hypothetical protein MAN_09567, partial [Metarhizium hybridum]